MSSLIYHKTIQKYHFREGHKPFKTKDGYTVYTLHIVEGPPPPKPEKDSKRKTW